MSTPATARKQLHAHALKHAEAWADEPWPGDHVVKVGKKIFAFLGGEGSDVSVGVKLPRSLLRFGKGEKVPLALLRSWIDESYETVAATALPKRKR